MVTPTNRERIVAIVSLIMFFMFVALIFVPDIIGMDMMRYGYGLGFMSLFLAIMCIVTFLIYNARANQLDRIFSGDMIVHWKYDKESWKKYAAEEFATQKKEKWQIYLTILPIALVVMVGFAAIKNAWTFSIVFIIALMGLLAVVAFIIPRIKYASDMRIEPEAWISKKGVYLTGEFHNWDMLTSKLEQAEYDKKNGLLAITYGYLTNTGWNTYCLRVPVPKGKEKDAKDAVKKIR
jgi:hypothetical protein